MISPAKTEHWLIWLGGWSSITIGPFVETAHGLRITLANSGSDRVSVATGRLSVEPYA